MKIKTKLRLGIGVLFMMIVLLSVIAAVFVNVLKKDTENILSDNYKTLEYSRNMLLSLDDMASDSTAWATFEKNLNLQQGNVTEVGEGDATQKVTDRFTSIRKNRNDTASYGTIRKEISEVMRINMESIQTKSDLALETVKNAYLWIAVSGTICFLIALILLTNLPGNIANPVQLLTHSIKEIAAKNYSLRIHSDRKDEFGDLAASFNTMAEKLEEYNNSNLSQILIEKQRIEALISNMREPVIGLNESKIILFANQEAAKITGLSLNEMIGKPAEELAQSNDLIRSLIQELKSEHTGILAQPSIKIYADNKESYFEKEVVDIRIVPTGEKTEVFIGQVIVLKNITPFKELDFAKTNFIAMVSHELKTPISSIKMSLKLLEMQQTGDLNNQQEQLVESIRDDSDRLLKITGELLNLTQVESGNIQLNILQASPEEIVTYALEAVKVQADQKQIKLDVTVEPDVTGVKADTEKTAWVMINFLTNAIRYSQPESEIEIDVKNENGSVLFSVKDQGKGIDSKYKEKVFDRYFQVPGSPKTGTGLGLAISKEFIEAQGGSIGVETEIGMGSTFYFKLASV